MKGDLSDRLREGAGLDQLLATAVPLDPTPETLPVGTVFVAEGQTWEATRDGQRVLLPYWMEVVYDTHRRGEAELSGFLRLADGRGKAFRLPAALLGDPGGLQRQLAGLLGSDYRPLARGLTRVIGAWLDASKTQKRSLSADFGLSADGQRFLDAEDASPGKPEAFSATLGSAAARLGLGPPDLDRAQTQA